ncbi:DNA polymerase delta, subunit 4-domain-containing protein [Cunninghamella echinulata]|nr:DNA polymerase delta, subunit 4-domain-containing protein [Cunninghamella echinulata]
MSSGVKPSAPRQSIIKTRVKKRRNESIIPSADDYYSKATFLNTDNNKKNMKNKKENDKMDTDAILMSPSSPKLIEIHQENLGEVDKMLRNFDLDYKYGPCIGMSRLDRWERALYLGLNPPKRIKNILVNNDHQYQQPLYYEANLMVL